MMGADSEIFSKSQPTMRKAGRPRFDRGTIERLLAAGHQTSYICRVLKCNAKTVYRIKKEVNFVDKPKISEEMIDAASFDETCKETVGFDFKDWLLSKTKKANETYSFCFRVWGEIWNRPHPELIKDTKNQLADELAMKFHKMFDEDQKRIRRRLKQIRYFFRFMGRTDILDRHLTMSRARQPVEIRRIAEIEMTNFPVSFEAALQHAITYVYAKRTKSEAEEFETIIKLKICTQMRTGDLKEERELWGTRISAGRSNITVEGNQVNWHVLAKMGEEWDITFLPPEVKKRLIDLYSKRKRGEALITLDRKFVHEALGFGCGKAGLPQLKLHDLRKISLTWIWAVGVLLENATTVNVGWRDLNTARDNYLHYRRLMTREQRAIYVQNIPMWFNEGWEQFR